MLTCALRLIEAEPAERIPPERDHLGDVQHGGERGDVRVEHGVVLGEHPERVRAGHRGPERARERCRRR